MTDAGDSIDVGIEADAEGEVDAAPNERSDVGARKRSKLGVSLAIAALVVVLDQWSKRWALHALSDGHVQHVIWTLQFNLTFNSGMAFSRGQGIGPYIGAVALVVVVVLLLSLRRSGGWLSAIAVGLVIGGAVGNLIDRLFREDGWLRGRVVDFIDLQWFPIFNIADMAVTVGGFMLLVAAALESRSAAR
jgi:signal peptidase II